MFLSFISWKKNLISIFTGEQNGSQTRPVNTKDDNFYNKEIALKVILL